MKWIKIFFYPIYLITIFAVVLMSFNIIESISLLQKYGWIRYITDLPYLGRDLLLFLCGMMLIEFTIHNIHVFKLKRK